MQELVKFVQIMRAAKPLIQTKLEQQKDVFFPLKGKQRRCHSLVVNVNMHSFLFEYLVELWLLKEIGSDFAVLLQPF